MKPKHFIFLVFLFVLSALLIWQLLFYKNAEVNPVLPDIHLIFLGTTLVFFIVKLSVKDSLLEFIKIFVRTLFRVWLLIFITLTITRSMDRVGYLLSLTFIFGYFEGLLDLDKWLSNHDHYNTHLPLNHPDFKWVQGLNAVLFMSIIHVFCAFAVLLFSLYFSLN